MRDLSVQFLVIDSLGFPVFLHEDKNMTEPESDRT